MLLVSPHPPDERVAVVKPRHPCGREGHSVVEGIRDGWNCCLAVERGDWGCPEDREYAPECLSLHDGEPFDVAPDLV